MQTSKGSKPTQIMKHANLPTVPGTRIAFITLVIMLLYEGIIFCRKQFSSMRIQQKIINFNEQEWKLKKKQDYLQTENHSACEHMLNCMQTFFLSFNSLTCFVNKALSGIKHQFERHHLRSVRKLLLFFGTVWFISVTS